MPVAASLGRHHGLVWHRWHGQPLVGGGFWGWKTEVTLELGINAGDETKYLPR